MWNFYDEAWSSEHTLSYTLAFLIKDVLEDVLDIIEAVDLLCFMSNDYSVQTWYMALKCLVILKLPVQREGRLAHRRRIVCVRGFMFMFEYVTKVWRTKQQMIICPMSVYKK